MSESTTLTTEARPTQQRAKGATKAASSTKKATPRKGAPKAKKAAKKQPAAKGKAEKPKSATRAGSKTATVLDLLRRPKGATLKEMMAETRWLAHYADVRIMPTCVGNPVCGAVIAAMESA